jgi:hypothetical protein
MIAAALERRDLHNISINLAAAAEGLCGFTHIPSGRVCRLPCRHPGPCEFRNWPSKASSRQSNKQGSLSEPRELNEKDP